MGVGVPMFEDNHTLPVRPPFVIEIFRRPGDGAVTAAPARPGEEVRSREREWARFYPLAVVLAIGLGIAVRLYPILRSDFPLNDGGMFYAMVQDIQHHRF